MKFEKINEIGKSPKFNAGMAAVFLGAAAYIGNNAIEANNDAVRNDAYAEVVDAYAEPLELEEDSDLLSSRFRATADDREADRNSDLIITAIDLSTAGIFAATAVRRRTAVKEQAKS